MSATSVLFLYISLLLIVFENAAHGFFYALERPVLGIDGETIDQFVSEQGLWW